MKEVSILLLCALNCLLMAGPIRAEAPAGVAGAPGQTAPMEPAAAAPSPDAAAPQGLAAAPSATTPFDAEKPRDGGLVEKTVEAKGTGATRDLAITNALVEAVGKVAGVRLAAGDVSALRLEISATEKSAGGETSRREYATLGEEQRKRIFTLTRGLVKTYDVLSEKASELQKDCIDVTLSVTVVRYEAARRTQRRRIAVVPFRNLTATQEEALFTAQLNQELVNHLTQTRHFTVLDRNYLREKHQEFVLLQGDDVALAERARVGNTLGADYLLLGSIRDFAAGLKTTAIPYVNEKKTVIRCKTTISWRLIEAPTGQVLSSSTLGETRDVPVTADSTSLEWINELARRDGTDIGRRIVDIIYPLMPVAYANGLLTIAQGGETLAVGQRYALIRYGEAVIDPYTKESVGREEVQVGVVEIADIAPAVSHAKVVHSSVDLTGLQPHQFILRQEKARPAAKKAAPKKTMQPAW